MGFVLNDCVWPALNPDGAMVELGQGQGQGEVSPGPGWAGATLSGGPSRWPGARELGARLWSPAPLELRALEPEN